MRSDSPPPISVIVAARNAAPYIEQCLLSLSEGAPALDVIVVDDGSTDDTAAIVARLAARPHRHITLVRQDHAGLSAARNAGLSRATAEYIGFVDADDWVQPGGYALLLAAAAASGADVVIGNGRMIDHDSGAIRPFRDAPLLETLAAREAAAPAQSCPDLFLLDTSVCRRLFRRHLLDRCGFTFPEGVLFEDVVAHFQLLLEAARVRVVDCDLYRYRINHPGRITDRRDESVLTIFQVLSRCEDALDAHKADGAIWSRFIAFQCWVLRWLGSQVDAGCLGEFARGVDATAARFPRWAISEFRHAWQDDVVTLHSVACQLDEGGAAFLQLARGATP